MPKSGPPSAAHFASSPVESRATAAVCAFAGTSVALRTSAAPYLLNILGSPSASATAKLMSIPSSRLFSRAARQRASHVSSAMEPFSIAFISVCILSVPAVLNLTGGGILTYFPYRAIWRQKQDARRTNAK